MTETTTATVKSPLLSKTNITAGLMAIGALAKVIFDVDVITSETAAAIVAGGAALVVVFRTFTNSVLRK